MIKIFQRKFFRETTLFLSFASAQLNTINILIPNVLDATYYENLLFNKKLLMPEGSSISIYAKYPVSLLHSVKYAA